MQEIVFERDDTADQGVAVEDVLPPVIILNGEQLVTVQQLQSYSDKGETRLPRLDGSFPLTTPTNPFLRFSLYPAAAASMVVMRCPNYLLIQSSN